MYLPRTQETVKQDVVINEFAIKVSNLLQRFKQVNPEISSFILQKCPPILASLIHGIHTTQLTSYITNGFLLVQQVI